MKLHTSPLFAVLIGGLFSTSLGQEETCSTGMTEFAFTPQGFDSILINPTCTSDDKFTSSQLAWTIEPTTDSVSRIFSVPPEAVQATLDGNVLLFDFNDMGTVPEEAGVVIQVPENQLLDVTVEGILNFVRVTKGFKSLLSVNSLGLSSVLEADLTDSPFARLTVDTGNSLHTVIGEDISLQMTSVSSKLHITGSVLGGEYSGFANEVFVTGDVRDLSVSGNKNMLASSDCSSVVVDSYSSSCVVVDEMEARREDFPTVPCTFPGCEKSCVSTVSGACSCTEAECDGANSPIDEMNEVKDTSSARSIIRAGIVSIVAASVLASIATAAF